MKTAPSNRFRFFWIGGIVLLLLLAVYFIYSKIAGSDGIADKVETELIELVSKRSKGLYRLKIGTIEIDGPASSAAISDISLEPDSTQLELLIQQEKQPATIYSFRLEKLSINKADILAYISSKEINLHKLDISGGTLNITRLTKGKQSTSNLSGKEQLQQSIQDAETNIRIDTMHADHIDIGYTNLKKENRSIKNVFLDLYGFSLDSIALEDSSRILFSRKMRLAIDSIRFPLNDNDYQVGARQLVMTHGDTSITSIKDIYMKPAKNKSLEKLASGMPFQKDVFSLKISEIIIGGLNLPALLEDSAVHARMILVKKPELIVYHDQSLPASVDRKIGKYPHQMIRKLPFQLELPTLLIESGRLTYIEKNAAGDGEGKVQFTDISGKIGPLFQQEKKATMIKAELAAKFMGTSNLSAKFEFPQSANGAFSVTAKFSPFPVSILNEATIPLGNLRLVTGRITSLGFSLSGNNLSATGPTTMTYEDLQVEVLKPNKENGNRKNKLMSLVANSFMLHRSNQPGDRFNDAYSVTYQRVPTKSFFNLVWKTVFYSIKANTGIGAKGKDKDRAKIH